MSNDDNELSLDGLPAEPPALPITPARTGKWADQVRVTYAELAGAYKQLHALAEAALKQRDTLEDENADKADELVARIAEITKARDTAIGEAAKLREANGELTGKAASDAQRLQELENQCEELLNKLEDEKSFGRHFATVLAALSDAMPRGTDSFRITVIDEIENGRSETAENEAAKVTLSLQNDRLILWIQGKNPNTGELITKPFSLGQVIGELRLEQFLIAKVIIDFSFSGSLDDLPKGIKDALLPPDSTERLIGMAAIQSMMHESNPPKGPNEELSGSDEGIDFDAIIFEPGDIGKEDRPFKIDEV